MNEFPNYINYCSNKYGINPIHTEESKMKTVGWALSPPTLCDRKEIICRIINRGQILRGALIFSPWLLTTKAFVCRSDCTRLSAACMGSDTSKASFSYYSLFLCRTICTALKLPDGDADFLCVCLWSKDYSSGISADRSRFGTECFPQRKRGSFTLAAAILGTSA